MCVAPSIVASIGLLHADDLTKIIREEFGKGNDFCQKITSKTTGKKPEEVLNEFRNNYDPRIAVTVDMIATGTDVKPLECVFFMRDVRSAQYFEQMKGRGARTIPSADFQAVTPDAKHKTRFVLVDAIGVTEHDFVEPHGEVRGQDRVLDDGQDTVGASRPPTSPQCRSRKT